MWTEYHKRSDANHTGWINLIQSNTTHRTKFGLMRVQESYIDTFNAQVTAPGLFGQFEKTEGGGFMNLLHNQEERTH